jgi:hypothetical protein
MCTIAPPFGEPREARPEGGGFLLEGGEFSTFKFIPPSRSSKAWKKKKTVKMKV